MEIFFLPPKVWRPPLHIDQHGMTDAVRFLLDEKAEVNSKNEGMDKIMSLKTTDKPCMPLLVAS